MPSVAMPARDKAAGFCNFTVWFKTVELQVEHGLILYDFHERDICYTTSVIRAVLIRYDALMNL